MIAVALLTLAAVSVIAVVMWALTHLVHWIGARFGKDWWIA